MIPDDFFQMRLLFQEVDIAILQNLYIQVMEKEKDELIWKFLSLNLEKL